MWGGGVSGRSRSAAPTPLYAVYQADWGFSPITATVVFGVYALAVLLALLTVGSLSDHIGRRPSLFTAALLGAAAMAVFATAHGVGALMTARVLQGLATGAATGALGAGLIDLGGRARGTLANGIGPFLGMATGALGSSLLVQYGPAPTRLVYLVLLAVLLVQAAGVLAMPESSGPTPGALASLRPRIGVPAPARRALLLAAPCMVAVWTLGGLFMSLGPSLAHLIAGSSSIVLGGLAVLALAGLLARTPRPEPVPEAGSVPEPAAPRP